MEKPIRKSSDLDDKTKETINNSISLLRKSGLYTDDQIFDHIRRDFNISITAFNEISGKQSLYYNFDLELAHSSKIGAFAYVLIKCDLGHENEIISKLIELDCVTEAKGVLGDTDIFVKLDAKSEEQIEETVRKIRKIPHITSTNTLSSITSQGGK